MRKYHFAREEAREEKVMAACQCPEIGEHKLEHRDFVERINHLQRRFDAGPDAAAEEAAAIGDTRVNEALLSLLQDWLSHHILIEDMAFRPHAEHNPAAREAAKSFKATGVWWSR